MRKLLLTTALVAASAASAQAQGLLTVEDICTEHFNELHYEQSLDVYRLDANSTIAQLTWDNLVELGFMSEETMLSRAGNIHNFVPFNGYPTNVNFDDFQANWQVWIDLATIGVVREAMLWAYGEDITAERTYDSVVQNDDGDFETITRTVRVYDSSIDDNAPLQDLTGVPAIQWNDGSSGSAVTGWSVNTNWFNGTANGLSEGSQRFLYQYAQWSEDVDGVSQARVRVLAALRSYSGVVNWSRDHRANLSYEYLTGTYVNGDPTGGSVYAYAPDVQDWLLSQGLRYPTVEGSTETICEEIDIPGIPEAAPGYSCEYDVDPDGYNRDEAEFRSSVNDSFYNKRWDELFELFTPEEDQLIHESIEHRFGAPTYYGYNVAGENATIDQYNEFKGEFVWRANMQAFIDVLNERGLTHQLTTEHGPELRDWYATINWTGTIHEYFTAYIQNRNPGTPDNIVDQIMHRVWGLNYYFENQSETRLTWAHLVDADISDERLIEVGEADGFTYPDLGDYISNVSCFDNNHTYYDPNRDGSDYWMADSFGRGNLTSFLQLGSAWAAIHPGSYSDSNIARALIADNYRRTAMQVMNLHPDTTADVFAGLVNDVAAFLGSHSGGGTPSEFSPSGYDEGFEPPSGY